MSRVTAEIRLQAHLRRNTHRLRPHPQDRSPVSEDGQPVTVGFYWAVSHEGNKPEVVDVTVNSCGWVYFRAGASGPRRLSTLHRLLFRLQQPRISKER